MDRQTTDKWTDRKTNGQTDRQTYLPVCADNSE